MDNILLENRFCQFTLSPQQARWSLHASPAGGPIIPGARMAVHCRLGRRRLRLQDRWEPYEVGARHQAASPHGLLEQVELLTGPDEYGLRFSLAFALPQHLPLFLWKISIQNRGAQPVFIDRIELLDAAPGFPGPPASPAFYSNGWQSWSFAGALGPQQRFPRTRLGVFRAPTDANSGTPKPGRPGLFASDVFGVLGDRATRSALLAGFLSQQQHFGSLAADLRSSQPRLRLWANGDGARLDPGASIATDWACLQGIDIDAPDPLGLYVEAVARQHGLHTPFSQQSIPTGWCSWYQFSSAGYTGDLNARDIRENLSAVQRLHDQVPLQIVQVDDGFEAQVGDWLAFNPGFSQGVAPLAAEIRQAGLTPGLWLAPFIAHPASRLAADHPDWLLRNRLGRPSNAGYLWNSFAAGLDLTHPDALAYAAEVIDTAVHRWGFPYLKLDFLYAAALPGQRRDPTRTRAQVLRAGLEAIRTAAGPEAYLLGCGCPLGPAIGLVDAMRISADTARAWRPSFSLLDPFIREEPNLPAARNACRNALTRLPFHRRWWVNDPDCLLLRPQTQLTLDEVQTVATTIALTGGSLLLSDHLPDLPPERLRIAQALLPLIGCSPRVLDWFDSSTPGRLRLDLENVIGRWSLLAMFNWEDSSQDLALHLDEFGLDGQAVWHAREFWRSESFLLKGACTFQAVPPHSVILLAVRPALTGLPVYLGSDLHVSQGLEVTAWRLDNTGLSFSLKRPGRAHGALDLALPSPPASALLNGAPLPFHPLAANLYRFPLQFYKSADLFITFPSGPSTFNFQPSTS